jgi:hypothetical protein
MNTSIDKALLRRSLEESFNRFIDSFNDFDHADVNRIPFPGSWTPAQVASHIILATDGVPDGHTRAADRNAAALLPKIRPWWEDMSQKFQSPEPLQPDDKARNKHEILSELRRVKEKDLALVDHTELSAVCLDFELPSIGFLTRYEWLWFIEMHLNRHTFQLQNIRSKTG